MFAAFYGVDFSGARLAGLSRHVEIADAQRREGVRVIKPPHALGFLDPELPPIIASTASRKSSGLSTKPETRMTLPVSRAGPL